MRTANRIRCDVAGGQSQVLPWPTVVRNRTDQAAIGASHGSGEILVDLVHHRATRDPSSRPADHRQGEGRVVGSSLVGTQDPGAGATYTLLQAKVSPSGLPRGHVSRSGLIDACRGDGTDRLVSVTAPAGYGKTTLLAEWASCDQRSVGWVSLDEGDNDPVSLIASLSAAFGSTQGLPARFWESMSGPGGAVLGRLGPRLASAMASAERPFVLMVDDLHEVTSLDSHDVIDLLVGSIPDGSTFVMAGRTEAPGLAGWRVRTPLREFGSDHLAFDSEEATKFFRLGGSSVPTEVVGLIHEQVEGWVAGLQLALLAARRDQYDTATPQVRFVGDYLRHEILDKLSVDQRTFLLRTSVLRQMTAGLCDALVGRSDSAAHLDELERTGLFVRPVGGGRVWYSYHAAFRETLLAELERSEPAAVRNHLHQEASRWYERSDMSEEAVDHALLAGDTDRASRLVAQVAQVAASRGRLATLERWLGELGDSAVRDYPPLVVLAGWVAALSGVAPSAARWAAVIDELHHDEPPTDGTESFESARAMFRALVCPDGPDRMVADADEALAREPVWSEWRSTAEQLTAEALLIRGGPGDSERAIVLLEDSIESARRSLSVDSCVASCAHRALIAMDHSDWAMAESRIGEALELVDAFHMQDYLVSTMVYAVAARLALHHGDQAKADQLAAQAMRIRGIVTYAIPYWAVRVRLVLIRLHLAMGRPAVARHLLHEVDLVLQHRPRLGTLLGEVDQVRVVVTAAPVGPEASPLSAAELRVLPYLQTHLTFDEIAERLFISRNTIGSHARSIYRKLDASSRGEAVTAAISLGLLGDFEAKLTYPGSST